MGFTEREDLLTIFRDHSTSPTFAQNANLDGEPIIKLSHGDGQAGGDKEDGEIIIYEKTQSPPQQFISQQNQFTRVKVTVDYIGQTDCIKKNAVFEEMWKAINTNNSTLPRTYYIRLQNKKDDGNPKNQLLLFFDMTKELEPT